MVITDNIIKTFIILVRFKHYTGCMRMSKKTGCHECEHAKDLYGCASKHVEEARRMISEGKPEEADKQLHSLEKHLKE
jgi:hypothetical protein